MGMRRNVRKEVNEVRPCRYRHIEKDTGASPSSSKKNPEKKLLRNSHKRLRVDRIIRMAWRRIARWTCAVAVFATIGLWAFSVWWLWGVSYGPLGHRKRYGRAGHAHLVLRKVGSAGAVLLFQHAFSQGRGRQPRPVAGQLDSQMARSAWPVLCRNPILGSGPHPRARLRHPAAEVAAGARVPVVRIQPDRQCERHLPGVRDTDRVGRETCLASL